MSTNESTDPVPGVPLVIKGRADADEIAAVVAVLAAAGAAAGSGPAPEPDGLGTWADRASLIGQPVRPGPGGWRSSARPR